MIKRVAIFCLFCNYILNAQQNKDISLRILDPTIIENKDVKILIKNNSKKNYYILIDTLFLADAKYNNDFFLNPYFVLSDIKNNEVLQTAEILERGSISEIETYQQDLSLLEIKSSQSLNFKIPFRIKRIVNDKLSTTFYINRKEKYFAQVKYKLTKDFLNKYMKNRTDILQLKRNNVYIGSLISNKVEVILEK